MTGYLPMLGKEFTEIVRTWRIWLVAGAFVAFGIIDPLLAKFMKQILGSVVGGELPLQLPDATHIDAWAQWTKDLTQLLLIVVLVVAAGAIAGELSSGTSIMPLTKPVSRASFVLAKFTAVVSLVTVSAVIGTALTSAVTALIFDDAQFAPIWRAVAVWLVFAMTLMAATIAASCLVPSTVAAFGIGFGCYVLLGIVALWQPARVYSPAGLPEAITVLAHGRDAELVWPIGTALLATAVFVALAVVIFRRKEL